MHLDCPCASISFCICCDLQSYGCLSFQQSSVDFTLPKYVDFQLLKNVDSKLLVTPVEGSFRRSGISTSPMSTQRRLDALRPQAIYSKGTLSMRKSKRPTVRIPLSSRHGVMSSRTTMIFWKESSMRWSDAVSCLLFSSSGMDRADWM